MKRVPLLQRYQAYFEQAVHSAMTTNDGQTHDELEARVEVAITQATHRLALVLLKDMHRRSSRMLREQRALTADFEKRNLRRWCPIFDLLETMIVVIEELGEACDREDRKTAQQEDDFTFEALSQLLPRAVLVAREVVCLLKGGYPDGALSRWRSLHELNVTAMLLLQSEQRVAHRYLANFYFQARRAALQYNAYSERAGLKPFSPEELAELEAACTTVASEIEGTLLGDYGWAFDSSKKPRPTFSDLEKEVQMDHWRPRYRWASQHIHSGHRPPDRLLGVAESRQSLMLVGPSNSGFVDPLHMTAVSLMQIGATMLTKSPTLDRIAYAELLMMMADLIGERAPLVEASTLKEARRKEKDRCTGR